MQYSEQLIYSLRFFAMLLFSQLFILEKKSLKSTQFVYPNKAVEVKRKLAA